MKLNRYIQGFSLIELMITIAIIGILASIAMPSYRNYVRNAEMANVVALGDMVSKKVVEFYTKKGKWPDNGKGPDRNAVFGTDSHYVYRDIGDGSLIRRTMVDDRDGQGQIYFEIYGPKFGLSGYKWIRLQFTDAGGMIRQSWCSPGGNTPTPSDLYQYLPC